jgi:hypothetical protein
MLFLYPFQVKPINKFYKLNMIMKKDINNNIVQKEIKAMNVGLSLNIMTKIATDIRYGKNIIDLELFILEFLLGYHTYGVDRYRDDGIIDNRQYIYDIIFIIIISIIVSRSNNLIALPFEFLIYLTRYYKDMKPYLNIFKSLYISILWCISIIILPSVLHDNNFNILQEPLDYVPYILLIIANSNNKDLKDIEEDKNNNVDTIPVKYGVEISKKISNACMIIFFILLSINLDQKFNFFIFY